MAAASPSIQHSPISTASTAPVQSDEVDDGDDAQFTIDELENTRRSPERSPSRKDRIRERLSTSPLRESRPIKNVISSASSVIRRLSKDRNKSTPVPSPTKSVFHTPPERRGANSPTKVEDPVGQQILPPSRDGENTNEKRPAYLKRSPASHSSYGVCTSIGPPPAISTQRTLTTDRAWKPLGKENLDLAVALPPPTKSIETQPTPARDIAREASPEIESVSAANDLGASSPGKEHDMEGSDLGTPRSGSLVEDKDQTLKNIDSHTEEEAKGSSAGSREDLFLNLAKAEEDKTERRRSRIFASSPAFSNETPRPYSGRLSLNEPNYAASAHPLDDSSRRRYPELQKPSISTPRSVIGIDRESSPESPRTYSRRLSNADGSARAYRQSNLGAHRSNRLASASVIESPIGRYGDERGRNDDTTSTVSTTAPSTLWDEMDELKSRIKKLELTGRLPPSSAAAMTPTHNDRPQTATTTVTTISSSPKHGRTKDSPVETAIEGISSDVHPLLHQALHSARSAMARDVYRKLETTAADALQLASMMAESQTSGGSVVGGGSSSERQARRKVDNLCRGLTELSIALSAQQPQQPQQALVPHSRPGTASARPPSRDNSSPSLAETAMRYADSASRYRRGSHEPDDRNPPTPRIQSRLDTRRSSIVSTSQLNSPRYVSAQTNVSDASTGQYSQPARAVSSRLNRNSLSLRNRRAHGLVDGSNDEYEEENPRPISRAMTEAPVSSFRQSPRDRTSFPREYTSQHPLPRESPRSPSVMGSNLSTRRTSALHSSPLNQVNTSSSALRRHGSTATTIRTVDPTPSRRYVPPSPTTALPQFPPDYDDTASISSVSRSTSLRQRLGAASNRIGSTVGSRLRAAKEGRIDDGRERQEGTPTTSRRGQAVEA